MLVRKPVSKKRLTLAALEKRIVALEKQMSSVSDKASYAYVHTMRIGGNPRIDRPLEWDAPVVSRARFR